MRILHPLAIILTVALLRIAWVFCFASLPRLLRPVRANTRRVLPWQETAVVAWFGMRGGVSLAAALAVPFVVHGAPLPHRELIIYATYAVILATLVCQGLTLPALIRRLGVVGDEREGSEERRARTAAAQAGLECLSSLADDGTSPELIDDLRSHLLDRKHRYGKPAGDVQRGSRWNWDERVRVRRAVVDAERTAVIDLRDRGEISDRVMRRIEAELDLEEVRLDTHDDYHQSDAARDGEEAAGDARDRNGDEPYAGP